MNGTVAPEAESSLRRVAYFSMEIALEPEIPTYSGGLGVLSGDTLRSAADLAQVLFGLATSLWLLYAATPLQVWSNHSRRRGS
jgi:glycogen phosphorylase